MPLLFIGLAAVILFWRDSLGGAVKSVLGYVGGKPKPINVAPIGGGLYLRTDAAGAFLEMKKAAGLDGVNLMPTGPRAAFRTSEEQADLKADPATSGFAAHVNYSPHQAGIAIDLVTNDGAGPGTNDAYNWLLANGSTFGFFPLSNNGASTEPWHFEYHPQ